MRNPNQVYYKPDAGINFRPGPLTTGQLNSTPKAKAPVAEVYTGVPLDLLAVAPYGDDHDNRNWYRRTFGRYPNFTGPRVLSFIRAQAETFKANFGRYPNERAAVALGAEAQAEAVA